MAGSGLLDKLKFQTESESEPFPETSLLSDSELEGDSEFDMPPDPAPKRPTKSAPKAAGGAVTQKIRKEVQETIGDLVDLPIDLWAVRDPHCAGVASEQRDKVVEAFTTFVCKRPAWIAAITDIGMSADWLKMTQALYPVLLAIYAHHIAKTVQEEGDEEDDLTRFHAPRLAG